MSPHERVLRFPNLSTQGTFWSNTLMSRSTVDSVVWDACRMVVCIFNDVARSFPADQDSLAIDLREILGCVEERGIGALCTDLPNVCKALDRALDDGRWSHTGLPLTEKKGEGIEYPRLLGCLFSYVFDDTGLLRKDYSHEAITCLRQIYRCCKKLDVECPPERVYDEVHKFLETEDSLPPLNEYWEVEETTPTATVETYPGFRWSRWFAESAVETAARYSEKFEESLKFLGSFLDTLDKVCGRIASLFFRVEPGDWMHKHGPGAVSSTDDWEDKYDLHNWPDRLDSAFPYADHAFPAYHHWASHFGDWRRRVTSFERSSRLCSVPKTFEKPRLIAAEPVENMWCQQFLRDAMYSTIEESWLSAFIPIRDQEVPRQVCLKASETGELATMDLSEASDRVSCEFVGNLFRTAPRFLMLLRASRTLSVYISKDLLGDTNGKHVKLRKYATMGNATTFPVESLGFLAVAIAAVFTHRRQRVTVENIRSLMGEVVVFGDDLIVPKECAGCVGLALEALNFKVNRDKTFCKGNFRESCGMEAFGGKEVSTTYICLPPTTRNPRNVDGCVDISNNLYVRGWLDAAAYLCSRVRNMYNVPYVAVGARAKGFWCHGDLPNPKRLYKMRWNDKLHRPEARVTVLTGRSDRSPRPGYLGDLCLLQYFTERPAPDTNWVAGRSIDLVETQASTTWVPLADLGYEIHPELGHLYV